MIRPKRKNIKTGLTGKAAINQTADPAMMEIAQAVRLLEQAMNTLHGTVSTRLICRTKASAEQKAKQIFR